ncbi:MAG TPA: molecular chaperone TorD family protein [Wenzhouxiangellaceae bacterium]|nr:molecular chaperone TorD family protein [Wenzhouxiangellaceae bacterium]
MLQRQEEQDISAMQFESGSETSATQSPTASSRTATSQSDEKQSDETVEHLFLEGADESRADTYRILSRLFRAAPDADLLQRLAECGNDEAPESKLTLAWNDLAGASRGANPVVLDHEFHAMFIGLGRGEVLPYASWYLSGFLLDKPLARLREDLARLGIDRAEDVTESEDHFAALCETMALLVAPEDGIDLSGQKHFFDRHIQPWFGHFLADVQAAKSVDYYRPVARLAQAFFEFEQRWLSLPQ